MMYGQLSASGSIPSAMTAEDMGALPQQQNRIMKLMTLQLSFVTARSPMPPLSPVPMAVKFLSTSRCGTFVSHLVLIGPAATGFPYSEWFLMLQRAEMQSSKVEDLISASTRSTYLIAPGHDAARKRLHDILAASPQDLTHDDMPLPEKPTFPSVQELRMPTLILVGSSDAADNHAAAGALVMAIPGAVRVVVPETGHLMYLEKPNEFFSVVSSFLNAHGL
jgi:pimeloyl-ACP methyl ester carboxylesterase